MLLKDSLNEYTYAAQIAQLSYYVYEYEDRFLVRILYIHLNSPEHVTIDEWSWWQTEKSYCLVVVCEKLVFQRITQLVVLNMAEFRHMNVNLENYKGCR